MIIKPWLILIDVDGTLVDSVPDLAYCVDTMMSQLGMLTHGEDTIRHWVGNGVERLVRRALVGQLEGEPDEAQFQQAYPIFLELYKDNVSRRSCLYPGVMEGIEYLKSQAYSLACVTNKAEQFTLPLLKDLNIYDPFELIICGDTLAKKKPDPLPLLHAARHFGVQPQFAMMVGDSVSDVKAARAAGFQIVCMSYGYNHGQDIRLANPDAVIDSMVQLEGLLASAG